MRKSLILALCAAFAAGCATVGGWKPVIDSRVDAHPENIDRDLAECRDLAKEASGGVGKSALKGTAMGAVGGAAIGAVLGAVSGDAGGGAAIGSALGGTGGAVTQGLSADEQYKVSYLKCLEGRGHRVIN